MYVLFRIKLNYNIKFWYIMKIIILREQVEEKWLDDEKGLSGSLF